MKKKSWVEILGEVAIVVFGILIAFGLNNWAQTQSNIKKEIRYLQSLREDVARDSVQMAKEFNGIVTKEAKAREVIGHFYQPLPGRDTVAIMIFRDLAPHSGFQAHEGTYQALTNSGDINLLRNLKLQTQVFDYYNRLAKEDLANEQSLDFTKKWVIPYFMNNYSFENMNPQMKSPSSEGLSTEEMLQDYHLKNIVFSFFGIYMEKKKVFQRSMENCSGLLEAIDAELEKLQ